jgi:DNA-binding NarL/FixJ family response regulator
MQTYDEPQLNINAHEQLLEELSTMLLQINGLQTLVRGDASRVDLEALRDGLTELEQLAREAIYELRTAHDELPLAELLGVPLSEALSRILEETAESLGLSSRVSFSGAERSLPSYIERLLYRIVQEALYQVQQHRNARRLRFTFSYGRDEVQMGIEDDGTLSMSREETPVPHFDTNESGYLTDGEPDSGDLGESGRSGSGRDSLRPYVDLRHRIEHLGGTLEVSTDVEKGTRVQARVPYKLPDATANQTTTTNTTPSVGAARSAHQFIAPSTSSTTTPPLTVTSTPQVRVLVVDHQSVSRAGLRRLLESYPDLYVIGEAADGVQAVSETLELGPQVVLMDAHLPNGQSMEALKQIKQLNLDTRVLLLSAHEREEYLYETLRAGADGYVLKDIAPDELAQAVRTVARGEVLVQSQLAGRLLSRVGKQNRGGYLYEALTAREQEVLQLLARGLRNKEIAARLHVSERTVNFHLANIYQKLNVSGRTEALSRAIEQGLITA